MSLYEIATLKTHLGAAPKAAPGLQSWLSGSPAELLGAFTTDIGPLNEILLLRRHASADALLAERQRTLLSDDPMGCAEHLVDMRFDTYVQLDFMPEPQPGAHGKVYEVRSYRTKLNGMRPTQDKWREAVPARSAYSQVVFAGWGLDGPPRLTQIWPYASLDARAEARAQSVADGVWPPQGGPAWLDPSMTSAIAMPLPFSPMS